MHRIVNPFVYNYVNAERMPNPTLPAWLDETYSQNYEDIVLCQMFRAYICRNNITATTACYVEVGGNHPVCTSASFLLHKTYGITGIIVEPDPKLAANLRKYRPRDRIIEAAVIDTDESELDFYVSEENELSTLSTEFVAKNNLTTKTIKVKTIRINEILKNVSDVESVFLSIDIEGLDLKVLKDIDFNLYHPHFITIEPSEHIVPGTTQEIINFLKEKNYRLVAQNYVNLIFEDGNRS